MGTNNQTSFKKGNKAATAATGKPKERMVPVDFKRLLNDQTNWKRVLKTLHKMSFGGFSYTKITSGGVTVTLKALPDKDWMRMLLEYAKGKPIQITDTDEDTKVGLQKFVEFISGVSGTKSVNPTGQVVEVAEQNTETTEQNTLDTSTESTKVEVNETTNAPVM